MPNQITASGIETATQAELIASFTAAYQSIYGTDINLDQDTPDGQLMLIYIQSVLDNLDLMVQVFNSFDPDFAIGNVLDQRVTLNGIQRQAGTYSYTPVSITVSESLTLNGVEDVEDDPYTVEDDNGNKWFLQNTYNFTVPGTQSLSFRAEFPGAVLTQQNTITVPVTIVLGVTTINNPLAQTVIGLNEETDASLRVRRQKSVSLSSQGYLAGLLAALENINGVTSAFVYENNTGATDIDGVPSHSIWVIVAGGTDQEIAEAIYTKRNAGAGMFGAQSYDITQVDGTLFTVYWDIVVPEDVWIKFSVTPLDGVGPVNVALILAQLPGLLSPGVNEQLNINDLATLVQQIDPNALVTNSGFSLTELGSYTPTLSPSSKNKQFAVDASRITITEL